MEHTLGFGIHINVDMQEIWHWGHLRSQPLSIFIASFGKYYTSLSFYFDIKELLVYQSARFSQTDLAVWSTRAGGRLYP